ncbi:sensor histidine kinase [Bacillus marasmi]|uniref:sensor histidine kinase n=1 Tax=Bacillus marasmi TaxID=1926279 RepID=UPI0011C7263A|nr:HAMP domain-containing sensor histidine kinase [Bacillus marasmi]
MEFNRVKSKLNLLYTGSLLFILIIFIIVLYLLISGAIKKQEIEQLDRFYEEEKHEFIEDIYENRSERVNKEHEGEEEHDDREYKASGNSHEHELDQLEYDPDRGIFYYVFDKNHYLVKGEEAVSGLARYIYRNNLHLKSSKMINEIEWEKSHLLIISYSLQDGQNQIGSVTIGLDVTDEKHLIQNIIWILLLLTLMFSLLFAFAGNFFAGQAMKPILRAFNTQKKFVSDASHELRTPLSIFYSSIDVLSSEERENLSPFGKEILEDVKNESEMMNKLLNDLLFLARNDQGNFELEIEELDLSLLLSTLMNRFRRIVPSHLSLEESIQTGIVMKGDKVRIQQLLYILLDNAMRYTKEGKISCSLTNHGREIVLSIKDTGPGIPQDEIIHIFDRFYRADSSRKRDGSGLGLSIAKTIVDAHSGKIEVKSEIGVGTEFMIKFIKK